VTCEVPAVARRPLLLLARNLPPLVGGMERLNLEMARIATRLTDCHVVGPAGAAAFLPDASLTAVPASPLWRFAAGMGWHAVRLALTHRPSWVIAGSGLTAPFALAAARLSGGRAAAYVHGLDIVVESWLYRRLWLPAIRRMDRVIANSEHTRLLAIAAGMSEDRIRVVNPGVDVPEAPPPSGWRALNGLSGRKVLLSVGRLTPRKGLVELIRNALPAIVASWPETILAIIGDEPSQALHASARGERQRIIEAAASVGLTGNVVLLGGCDEASLMSAYAEADVLVFPVRDLPNDVEGFGMVALEAAAHGLPTVAFAVGGVPDAVSDGVSGRLVRSGDYARFADGVSEMLALGRGHEVAEACARFARGKDWRRFAEQLAAALDLDRG
jgi:phosphatidyl-myo-inositol dimannoside synthase